MSTKRKVFYALALLVSLAIGPIVDALPPVSRGSTGSELICTAGWTGRASKAGFYCNSSDNTFRVHKPDGTEYTPGAGGGSGTVTSVGLTAPAIMSVTGSPVTSAGTLALTMNSQTANQCLCSPNGSSGAPSSRALVAGDIPDLSSVYGALGGTNTWTGTNTTQATEGTTATPRVSILGSAMATLGAPQYSGGLRLGGSAWASGSSTSQTVQLMLLARPIEGTSAAVELVLYRSLAGGAWTEIAKWGRYSATFDWPTWQDANGDGFALQAGTVYGVIAGAAKWNFNATGVSPQTDGGLTLGSAVRWNGLYNKGRLSAGYTTQSGTTYTVGAEVRFVGMSNSAARTVTLPAASSVLAGQMIVIKDEAGTAAAANVTAQRAGSDTIDGGTSATISTNYGVLRMTSNGVDKWWLE